MRRHLTKVSLVLVRHTIVSGGLINVLALHYSQIEMLDERKI